MKQVSYILLTGATGFIGSHVAERLLHDQSFRVVAIVRKRQSYKNTEDLQKKGAFLVEGTFYDKDLLETVFHDFPVKYVIHLAAIRGAGSGTKDSYHKVNVLGTEILLEASLRNGVKRFIFCSSVGVFGTIPRTLPGSLTSPLNGDNLYHQSKILAEKHVLEYTAIGLDTYIIRPTITYGFGDTGFSKTLVELVRKRALLLSTKDNKIHLLYVTKLAELIYQILEHRNLSRRIFIAADEEPILLRDLVDLIHFHYFGNYYPGYLRLPPQVFRSLVTTFRFTGNAKWLTKILLLSEEWYYDITDTVNVVQYRPAKTENFFLKSMCSPDV